MQHFAFHNEEKFLMKLLVDFFQFIKMLPNVSLRIMAIKKVFLTVQIASISYLSKKNPLFEAIIMKQFNQKLVSVGLHKVVQKDQSYSEHSWEKQNCFIIVFWNSHIGHSRSLMSNPFHVEILTSKFFSWLWKDCPYLDVRQTFFVWQTVPKFWYTYLTLLFFLSHCLLIAVKETLM